MIWPAMMVGSGRFFLAGRAYLHARVHAARLHAPQPASWWGLCALLSQHQMRHGRIRPMPELWSELLPFLLMENESTPNAPSRPTWSTWSTRIGRTWSVWGCR